MLLLKIGFIDRSMATLYNMDVNSLLKKMEKSKLRLLVVEDEKKLCDMIAKSLHLAGYEVGYGVMTESRYGNDLCGTV